MAYLTDMEPQTASAQTVLEIECKCPHCGKHINLTGKLKRFLDDDLRATGINFEIDCPECETFFIITEIQY